MIRWFLRGVSRPRVTTRYPRGDEPPPAGFRTRALLDPDAIDARDAAALAAACLPGALAVTPGGGLRLDGGRCIGCGLCAQVSGQAAVTMDPGYELATRSRERLVVGGDAREADVASATLAGPFRRSLHVRHVDTGSDGAIEQEIAALLNPYYDMQRLGLFFTASPRHADVLLVTGPVTRPMEEPLRRTYEAMPEPRVVVAAGTDACSGGIWTAPEVLGGVDRVLAVDVYIPGDPPSPIALLHGLLLAAGRVRQASAPRRTSDVPATAPGARGGSQ
jgi:Ni,Fe-hydrogenase III small subunit/formate hydrogenlyase subunit 6/NADH:ubiquinone oxidoreductase subunit I